MLHSTVTFSISASQLHFKVSLISLWSCSSSISKLSGTRHNSTLTFFPRQILVPIPDGVGTAAMQEKYKEVFDESISINTINYHYLQPLENMDLISRDNDPNNKRRKLTVPLREKVFTGEARIRTLFEKGDIFTLKNLEEAFSELKQLIVRDTLGNIVKIKDYDDTVINVETLYDKYFSQKCLITAGFANNYLSEQEEDLKLKKEIRDKPLLETGTISLSLGEKLEIVYSKCRELAVDGLVSKFAVTDALKVILDRNEVFKLLAKLESEGKLVAKGPEWYRVV